MVGAFTAFAAGEAAKGTRVEGRNPSLDAAVEAKAQTHLQGVAPQRDIPLPIVILDSSLTQLVIQVNLPELHMNPSVGPDGNLYTGLDVVGSGIAEPGGPAVPVFGFWILIPNGTEAQLRVQPGSAEVLSDLLVPPVRQPWADLDGVPPPPFERNEQIYATNADYPGALAELEPTRLLRGQQATVLRLFPYQHNPVRRTLSIYSNLTVTVEFQGRRGVALQDNFRSQAYDRLMYALTLNASAVLSDWDPTPVGSFGWDYLILYKDSRFQTAANTFAAWKTKLGFKTLVEQLPASWKASDIKNALQNSFDSWALKPQYVFIIGDADTFPCHYMTPHPWDSQTSIEPQGKIGTDLYYATLSGFDLEADLSIGRISVRTASEAEDRVRGIINYEKTPPSASSFYNTATIAAYFQDEPVPIPVDRIEDHRYIQTAEDLAIFLSNPSYGINKNVERIYYAEATTNPGFWNNSNLLSVNNFGGGPAGPPGNPIPAYLQRPTFAWDGDHFDITTAVEAGTFLLVHRDHGRRIWWFEPHYETFDVLALQNYSLLPVVLSVDCETGWFDNETDFPGAVDQTGNTAEAMSEFWERPLLHSLYDVGAVGVLAPTRITYDIHNSRLLWGWTDAIWGNFLPSYPFAVAGQFAMGEVLSYGKLYMSTKVEPPSSNNWSKAQYEGYHWFGDPSMEIRTFKPKVVVASLPGAWPYVLHPEDYVAHVEWIDPETRAGGPLAGAMVTITRPGSTVQLERARSDENGDVRFPDLLLAETGTYNVVASASNTVPYVGSFAAQVGPAGGILISGPLTFCSASIEVRLGDANLIGAGNYELPAYSSGGDSELAILHETGSNTGYFVGTIWTASGSVVPGDGLLQVSDGETVTFEYLDADDGTGSQALIQVTALVDCMPPAFAGLRSATLEEDRVLLEWDPAIDEHGPISYAVYRADLAGRSGGVLIGTTMSLSYPDYEIVPGAAYSYGVRARDAMGNEDSNSVTVVVSIPARLASGPAAGGSSLLRRLQRN